MVTVWRSFSAVINTVTMVNDRWLAVILSAGFVYICILEWWTLVSSKALDESMDACYISFSDILHGQDFLHILLHLIIVVLSSQVNFWYICFVVFFAWCTLFPQRTLLIATSFLTIFQPNKCYFNKIYT